MSINPVENPLGAELHRVIIFRLRQGDAVNPAAAGVQLELLPRKPGESISGQDGGI